MNIQYSNRYNSMPVYLFARQEKIIQEKRAKGADLITLGIGDPDLPTPEFIRKSLAEENMKLDTHNYSVSEGEPFYREAVREWVEKRFGVKLDAEKEVLNCLGSKEGIANIARAFVNPGEVVLCPNPGYPVYERGATMLCDGFPVRMPVTEENNYLPDLSKIDKETAKKAKMIYVNYPNNPTGATATDEFLKEAIDFCVDNEVILCYDNAYSEFYFDGKKPRSILEFDNAMECSIEFNSLSKTFCMTGDRVAFATGNAKLIAGLNKIKSNIDSGCPVYIQKAGATALSSYKSSERPREVMEIVEVYEERRNVLHDELEKIGVESEKPAATFYYWLKVPEGFSNSTEFADKLLEKDVVIAPGVGFGEYGEGYVRFALTQPKERIKEAVRRVSEILS